MQLKDGFKTLGVRVKVTEHRVGETADSSGRWRENSTVMIGVRDGGGGEYFKVTRRADVEVEVLEALSGDRHLLVGARLPASAGRTDAEQNLRFLCGRDERHWFVAAIPEAAGANDVQS